MTYPAPASSSGRLVRSAALAHLRWDAGYGAATTRPPVLLLHGIGGGRQAWGDGSASTGATLAAAGHPVLALDLPGYGLSPSARTGVPPDLVHMAEAVLQLVHQLDAGPVVLVGHSMGGMVAQALVAMAPQMVCGLVLASTSPAFGKPGGDWQQAFLQSRCAPLDAGLGMAGLAAQLVPGMVAPGTPASVQHAAQTVMAGVPEATYRSALAALLQFDQRANLPQISMPTLVITGALDAVATPEVSRRMAAAIPGAQCVVVPGAGHLLPMENRPSFNAALLAFLLA